ncbi:MAG: hypothetical protein GFH27_549303n217 [Chloroflexi bacterium AL-W]|nr:hypothetical protein [Chloroflexi bacterium AL-N1]NOK68102.1 hypothetical protein [Chloroflexi bacterium AL-N10]NOK73442.1 hypothetical protein [Chloroflexi bacterium AL-N5]NOK83356.1 hypothetical protein [Chloroflexi bacterium AL-W]NOK87773.1 hypothetical protein [Chloroflexi bacterium AL-N15]
MKRFILVVFTIMATLLGLLVLWTFGPALALFGGSLAIAAALRPSVQQIETVPFIGRGFAIVLCYVLCLAVLAVVNSIYVINVSTEGQNMLVQLTVFYSTIRETWQDGTPIQQIIAQNVPDITSTSFIQEAQFVLPFVGTFVGGIIGNIILLLAMLSLTYYWLVDATYFERLWLSLLPVTARARARNVWRQAETLVGTYIRTMIKVILAASVFLFVFYTLLQLPFPFMLAFIGAVAYLIPRLGPIAALLPAILVALAISPLHAVLTFIGGIAITVLVGRLADWSMRKEAFQVNPLLQVLVLIILVELGGLGAMLFAPPLAAFIQVLYSTTLLTQSEQPQYDELGQLRERLAHIRATVDPGNLELLSVIERGEQILQETHQTLQVQKSQ